MVRVNPRRKDPFFTPGKHVLVLLFMASFVMFGVMFLKVHRSEVRFVFSFPLMNLLSVSHKTLPLFFAVPRLSICSRVFCQTTSRQTSFNLWHGLEKGGDGQACP